MFLGHSVLPAPQQPVDGKLSFALFGMLLRPGYRFAFSPVRMITRGRLQGAEPQESIIDGGFQMKRSRIVGSVVALVICALVGIGASSNAREGSEAKSEAQSSTCRKIVRHVVSFKYKDTASPEEIQKVTEAFANLKNEIPFILAFECGTNVSPEKLDKGFTHCYILTFKNQKDRDAYLPHPAHKAFGKKLGGILDDVFVIDFETCPGCVCGGCGAGGQGGSGTKSASGSTGTGCCCCG